MGSPFLGRRRQPSRSYRRKPCAARIAAQGQKRQQAAMHRKTGKVLCAIAFVFTAAVVACSRPPDETRIRNAIAAMESAAEARDASSVLDHIGTDFTGQRGEVDRAGLARILKIEFLRKEGFDVSIGSIALEIVGD